jgi:hypothetical protein
VQGPTRTLEELLRPLKAEPERSAVLLDVDGVLAPIVQHPDDAHMPESTRRPLIEVARRYGTVACVSGRGGGGAAAPPRPGGAAAGGGGPPGAGAAAAQDPAAADSVRLARVISTQATLQARQDTIAQKLVMIQEIDAGRHIWPHILDEISRALPPYTWLESVDQERGGPAPDFIIAGRTGSLPALTRFMNQLEASPFLRNIQLISSEQAQMGGAEGRIVNNFALTGSYRPPPMDMLETIPLFPNGAVTVESEVSDGAGSP